MGVGVSTAIAIASYGQSAAAIAMAHEAKITACQNLVGNFDAKSASVDAMKAYADCVELLHPQNMSIDDINAIRLVLACCFIGAGVAAYCGYKSYGCLLGVFSFIVGFMGTGSGIILVYLLIQAIKFTLGI